MAAGLHHSIAFLYNMLYENSTFFIKLNLLIKAVNRL